MPELSTLGAVIKAAYEGEANTNAYTDTEKSKLSGIATGAEVNAVASVNGQTGAVTLTAADVSALPSSYSPAIADVDGLQAVLDDFEARISALEGT